jgi:hypothetical protein
LKAIEIHFKAVYLVGARSQLDRFKGECPSFVITLTHSNRKVITLVNRFITLNSVLLRFATHSAININD